jgi:hypothetical protein
VEWHITNRQWAQALSQEGGALIDPTLGIYTPVYFFLENDWRVRPMEANHDLTITGNLTVRGGGVPVVRTLGTYQVNVNYTVPVQAQGIITSGSVGPSSSEIATAVQLALITEFTRLNDNITSRLSANAYIDPDNVTIAQIKTKLDTLENTDISNLAKEDTVQQVKSKIDTNLDSKVSKTLTTNKYLALK